MSLTYGSLFAGYNGLGIGLQSILGGSTSWFVEFEAAPSKILAHHYPGVPNLGDVTKVDWASVPKVDVIEGGSPCQDLSHAGARKGMKAGTRSGLWASMCDAIEIIRPRLVVWENVRGALSAEADSAMEQCAGCVGDPDDGAVLRALGRVLGDLADLGYDASWYGLRAADVGAPHGRFRIFVFATDTNSLRGERSGIARGWRPGLADDRLTITDPTSVGRDEGWTESARLVGRPDAAERGDTPPADASSQRHGRGQNGGALGRVDGDDAGETRQRERSREVAGDRDAEITADTDLDGLKSVGRLKPIGRHTDGRSGADVAWGQYEPAIRRWEHILGRRAPAPTEPGPKGGQRLSPTFVEWLMGLPEGHVTGVKISRNDMLKALGNGVVPQQAAAATRRFLAHIESERAA